MAEGTPVSKMTRKALARQQVLLTCSWPHCVTLCATMSNSLRSSEGGKESNTFTSYNRRIVILCHNVSGHGLLSQHGHLLVAHVCDCLRHYSPSPPTKRLLICECSFKVICGASQSCPPSWAHCWPRALSGLVLNQGGQGLPYPIYIQPAWSGISVAFGMTKVF